MDELIYSVRKVFRDYLPSQGCDFFNIPEYQRGYKWTADNVKQLLNDLKNFRKGDSEAFYCLQNITITKSKLNEKVCMNVIDGQQRLTTLFIIVSYIQRNMMNRILESNSDILRYSVRKTTDEFLRTEIISGSLWNTNINPDKAKSKDQYYIMEVARAIDDWFKKNDLAPEVILDNLIIIVNKVDSGDEETVFASLNGGKVDLDGADLVRAILITRAAKQKYPSMISKEQLRQITNEDINLNIDITVSSRGKINEFRVKLGIELDKMNKWWSDRDVRNYFEQLLPNRISQNRSFKYSQYPIDLLYYAFYEAYKEYFTELKSDRDLELRFFENGLDLNGDNSDDHLEFYNAVEEFHFTMVDWYSNDEIYNLVGYLMYNFKGSTVTFERLWRIWKTSNSKRLFIDEIKRIINEQLAFHFSGETEQSGEELIALRKAILDTSYDWYTNDFTIKLLPLLDILPIEKKQKNSVTTVIKRIQTDYFKRIKEEDKEHVRSQTRRINEENITEEDKEAQLDENRNGLNSIGNIVLLHESINRSYGNDKHTLKMDRIANEFIMNNCYIRPHTFSVFISKLKNMDNNGINDNEIFWSDDDILKTIQKIDMRISKYLNFPEISQED
ncbi:DUF262 domain-containing protein [Gabonibacter massiliensis]|uniref:DUF262 domain-containing protein n=1 Tax=Gabonibacter massiliensis TaxID=1720195 RepID=UPI00073E4D7B|nr:DUF262 domain-containing protein [Gabonibacter massiliensis]